LTTTDEEVDPVNMSSLPRVGSVMRHFKGGVYRVVGHAFHTENEEMLVLYRCTSGPATLWARPLAMFNDSVNGTAVPRFRLLETPQDTDDDPLGEDVQRL